MQNRVRSSVSTGVPLTLLALFLAAGISPVLSCCMVPTQYPGDVDQVRQQGAIFFHDGHEVLVLRVNPTFPDFDYGPNRLTWIITVPASPTGYEAVDEVVFEESRELYLSLEGLARAQLPGELITMGVSPGSASLAVMEDVQVGPFKITEVAVKTGSGAGELNEYLSGRGFPTEPEEEVRWFIERNFRFLCIEISPPEGVARFKTEAALPALKIGFPSDRPYFPGKYSARQGNFALALTLFTSKPLDLAALKDMRNKLEARVSAPIQNLFTSKRLGGALASMVEALPGANEVDRWYVNALPSGGFNPTEDGIPQIATWTDDLFFSIGDSGDLPPRWYRGDLPARSPLGRHPFLALGVLASVWLLGIRVVKGRGRGAR